MTEHARYLRRMAKWAAQARSRSMPYEKALDALNRKGGKNWQEDLCQADIIATVVGAVMDCK